MNMPPKKAMPMYLVMSPEQFFAEKITERQEFSNLVNDKFYPKLHEMFAYISYNLERMFHNQAVLWIGGSRAWDSNMNCFFPDKTLNPLEATAIKPGNFDVFVMSNNKNNIPAIIEMVYIAFDKLYGWLESTFVDDYQFDAEFKGINPERKKLEENRVCTQFMPCHSLSIAMESRVRKRKKVEANMIKTAKLLVYIEIYNIEHMNIPLFTKKLLAESCKMKQVYVLNPVGLLFFAEFIVVPRKEKGMPIDLYRYNLIKRLIKEGGENLDNVYINLFKTYNTLFDETDKYDKNFAADMLYMAFKNSDSFIQDLDSQIIEKFRPFINTLLLDIHNVVHTNNPDLFLAIVGGDSMRRYKYDITVTNDIDAKLFIPEKLKGKSFEKEIVEMLIYRMTYLVAFLSANIGKIFKDNISGSFNGIKWQIKLAIPDVHQFRLRFLEESNAFPVNLFSIDYNYRIVFFVDDRIYVKKIDLAFLDVVLNYYNPKKTNIKDIVNLRRPGLVPIASRKYLLDDIETNYSHRDLALKRYWTDKVGKDLQRYNDLREKNKSTPFDVINKDFAAYMGTTSQAHADYIARFTAKITENHRKQKYKHHLKY